MAGIRERARRETTAEILRLAREQLACEGAAALSVREGTVRAHASRGLAALRVELSRRGIEGLPDLDADAEGGLR